MKAMYIEWALQFVIDIVILIQLGWLIGRSS